MNKLSKRGVVMRGRDAQAARPEVAARLRTLPGVTVVLRDEALKHRQAHSRIWNETWLAAFFHKPCNHELFVLQSLNMEGARLAAHCTFAPVAALGGAPLIICHFVSQWLRVGHLRKPVTVQLATHR